MGRSIRVLHVDDEPEFVDVTRTFLERDGDPIEVETATSAEEGLDRLSPAVDCVVSDFDLPGRNGIQFLDAVREARPDLPFVLFTGKGSEEVASEAISAGVTDYLQKEPGTEQFELLANRIVNAVDRYRATRRAADLRRIRSLVSDVNQALVRAETRPELEARVCELTSESAPYQFAWIGTVDAETDRIEPRAAAGLEDEDLDGVTITADDGPTGRGPAGTAARERRVAVVQAVQESPAFEPWRENVDALGVQSLAATPLEFEDTLYGVLAVGADRTDVFDERERTLLSELGDDIAHALHAIELRTHLERYETIVEALGDPVYALDADGHYTFVNDAFEEASGYSRADIVGTHASHIVPEEHLQRGRDVIRELLRSDGDRSATWELERITADGERVPVENHVALLPFDEAFRGTAGVLRDVTDRLEREERFDALHEATRELMQADTLEETLAIGTRAMTRIAGLDTNSIRLYDPETDTLRLAERSPRSAEVLGSSLGEYALDTTPAGRAFTTGEVGIDIPEDDDPFGRDPLTECAYIPIVDHGVFNVGSTSEGGLDRDALAVAEILASNLAAVLDRVDHGRRLERLHEATRDLMTATTPREVAERTTEAAKEVLRYPNNVVRLVDEAGNRLRPVATTRAAESEMGERPVYTVGEGPVGEVYERGQPLLFEDVRTVDDGYDRGDVRAVMYLPLGEHGTIGIGDTSVGAFDQSDLDLASVLAANTETALDRIGRERDLERQNERLEEFAAILSHDLRNPLNIATGRLELARMECDSEHLEGVADAHGRMDALIDDTLTLARQGDRTDDLEAVDLADVVEHCWRTVDTAEATIEVEVDRTVKADRSRLQQLLGNLVRNAIDHGGEGVTVTVGPLETGFYVADDGPGIPEEEREQVFDPGYTTTEEGTGFGLKIVEQISEAHDWSVNVTESESGGARFEIGGVDSADG